MSTFNPEKRGEFVVAVSALDVVNTEGHHHAVGMAGSLLIDRIDEIECMAGEVALIGFRLDPDGKELRPEVSGPGFVEADVALIFGIGRSDVEVFVEEALRGIGVRVNDDGGIVDLAGLLADGVLRVDGKGKCD